MSNFTKYHGSPTAKLNKKLRQMSQSIKYLCDRIEQIQVSGENTVREKFTNLTSGNSVTLSNTPVNVLVVLRNDTAIDTEGQLRYEVSGSNINVFPDFGQITANETIEVIYTHN